MNMKILLICFVTIYGESLVFGFPDYPYKSSAESSKEDVVESDVFGESSELALFSGETESIEEKESLFNNKFKMPKFSFSTESKAEETEFDGSNHHITKYERKETNTPVHTKTTFELSVKKPINHSSDQTTKATEGEKNSQYKPTEDIVALNKGKQTFSLGKSSHFSSVPNSNKYTTDSVKKIDDAEMILPHHEALYLPMVNGKPKPYDGYRAAPKVETQHTANDRKGIESSGEREERFSRGEIIYGNPRIAMGPYHLHLKRSAAEYHGGIHPYYDFTDSKLYWNEDAQSPNEYTGSRTKNENSEFFTNLFGKNQNGLLNSFEYEFEEKNNEGQEKSQEYTSPRNFEFNLDRRGSEEDAEESKGIATLSSENSFNTFTTDTKTENTAHSLHVKNQNSIIVPTFVQNLRSIMENSQKEKALKQTAKSSDYSENNLKKPTRVEIESNYDDIQSGNQRNPEKFHWYPEKENKPKSYIFQVSKPMTTEKPVTYRTKRSAKFTFRSNDVRSGGTEDIRDKGESSDAEYFTHSNRRNQEQRQFFFNQENRNRNPKNKFNGHSSSNIYQKKPQTFSYEWDSPSSIRNRKTSNRQETSKVYGGSFTYENSEETYGVPASIYEGINFESSEEVEEPYDTVREGKNPNNQEYYYRSKLTNRSLNDFKSRRHQDTNEKSDRRQHHSVRSSTLAYQNPSKYSQGSFTGGQIRPKKYAKSNDFEPKNFSHPIQGDSKKNKESQTQSHRTITTAERVVRVKNGNSNEFNTRNTCRLERRGNMFCTVCRNEKTSATYEQCRFSSREYVAYEQEKSDKNPLRSYANSAQNQEKSNLTNKKLVIDKALPPERIRPMEVAFGANQFGDSREKGNGSGRREAQSENWKKSFKKLDRREVVEDDHKNNFEMSSFGSEDNEKYEIPEGDHKFSSDEFEDAFLSLGDDNDGLTLHHHDEKTDFESTAFFGFGSFDDSDFGREETDDKQQYESEFFL